MESLLTVERLMTHLNLKRSQIDYLVKNWLIPHFRLPNGEVMFRASEIEIWLFTCSVPSNNRKLRKILNETRMWRCKQQD
jgi:predicted DNA-binding transcriptional regulator AlpA